MEIAGILALAIVAGVAVYAVSLRRGEEQAPATGHIFEERGRWRRRSRADRGLPADEPETAAADSFAYVPLAVADRVPIRTRLLGFLGIVLLIAVSAAALAAALWEAGHLVNQTIAKFLEK